MISRPEFTAVPVATADDLRERLRRKAHLKGRQPEASALTEVQTLIGARPPEGYARDRLIEHLHLINDRHGALYERHLVALARLMNLPMAEVYEVASFYHHFEVLRDADGPPRLVLRVCNGLSCCMAGADALLAELPGRLSAAGHGDVRVQAAPCVGRCEQAPVAVVHQCPVPRATLGAVLERVDLMPDRARAQHPQAPTAPVFEALPQTAITRGPEAVAPPWVGLAAYRARGGYALAAGLAQGRVPADGVLAAMEDSGLRGLGGAGFPAGRKWRIVREQAALAGRQAAPSEAAAPSAGSGPREAGERGGVALMAVNIDEGEPGTFKDRTYLERDPHRFLEGVLVAAQVVGTAEVYIYLRDEYHGCRALLQTAIAELQADPPCALPRIELRRGAGAYICGEESAMIESIEGKRGEPRMRPPYIAQEGLFGRPTLEHNFETLYWVRDIVEKGPQWFASFGRHGRRGLRSFSVSGRVKEPGVKLAPAGITLRELVDEYCGGMADGHVLYAYLPGGASGGILPARLADVPLDFDTLQPHGCFIGSAAVIVLSQHDRARDAALNMMRFFAHESCGQCTPCRVGTAKAAQLMQAPLWDEDTLDDLAQVMADASICGLGQAAPNPIRCIHKYFAHEVGEGPWPGDLPLPRGGVRTERIPPAAVPEDRP
ncbi:NADH-ubiquinone oxidoreductase-F iron-sulfur binding region domain-containing protein [Diaphorobacter sp. C33]|uniref:NAD-dependent formate dehydrogenase flavoprotein subunit n=1 Tax=Diaphorobacter nitroreducens TaxID=164759 RepID=A0AAX1WTT4_9BURK|nr:NADH-ubiquinone oxidoreductase-F iron-sulfur binding region domain-containing protein [Diaphorobacter sp. C33]ROR41789.1 NAD-dependent formate dehydrogenase flavoprotein subunit [Diaphorobacter nitroreducens]WKK88284.1 NADH-ubiquinone oxidoreductase-F iron-sulfur binding region domain-containing protein [Diaphorobacter sp. C33]